MGEYDRRIAVLRNLRGGALDLGDQRLDIPRADERGEFRTESQLLAPEIADLADTGMEHEALAQKPRICLVTPLAEELAFRGGALYLLQPLGGAGAVVVQAVLFAALHGSWTARAYALGMGLIFGWAAQKAKSVWPGSALHIINNCLVFAARLAERGMG